MNQVELQQANLPYIDQQSVVQCFRNIHSPTSSQQDRRQANLFLFQMQKNFIELMRVLVMIFDNSQSYNISIRFQSLLLLSNIIKRNWMNKRLLKTFKDFPQMKKAVSRKIIQNLPTCDQTFINTLYDMSKFIAKVDYPHSFQQFTDFQIALIQNLQIDNQFLKHFKQLKDIYLQLGERKGFVSIKNFQESLRRVVNGMGSLSEGFRGEIQKNNGQKNNILCKMSKYCDQILISIMRMSPYSLLDDEPFMMIPSHICMKLQNLLTLHNQIPSNIEEKKNLEKSIKSIIYGLGCLQSTNPCCIAHILSQYISILFSIISRPQLFHNPNTIKYSLLSMKKLIKQFTYFAPDELFLKSVSSQPKSRNYLELRNISHNIYQQYLKQQTVQGFLNFLLTNIMNIRTKQDGYSSASVTYGGLDEQNYANDTSFEKQLSIHISAAMVIEALLQRFTQMMLKLIYNLIQQCMKSNFTNLDIQTKINLCTVISIIPKCCKKQIYKEEYLGHFPILEILSHIHSEGSNTSNNKRTINRLRQKFPAIISGWIDVFSNQQINQLLNVLLQYISQDPQDSFGENSNMDLLLYSCFSLNKIIMLKSNVIDCAYILNKIFPIAIKIFSNTDNPEILWPLINLISSLITKCQFDTGMIVSSLQGASLQALISNDSQILIEALAEMFKNFLCVIPRQKPSLGIFQLIYHFLNTNLQKCLYSSSSSSKNNTNADKLITLWYYSIRQYPSNISSSNLNIQVHQQCSSKYLQLFQNYYRKCLSYKKQPILIYILEQYMLLDMIYNKMEDYVNIVVDFYQEGDFYGEKVDNPQEGLEQYNRINNISLKEDCLQLKTAALSFQITLITKYNIQQVNSQQMLVLILRDFCSQELFNQPQQEQGRSVTAISNTLQNSLLAIVNRYILLHPEYFFNFFLQKTNIGGIQVFYQFYFKNMEYLTSRTANKINAIALISLLPSFPSQMQSSNLFTQYLFMIFKTIIPQIEAQISNKQNYNQQTPFGYNPQVPPSFNNNIGRVQNSPVFRFSQSILSERKDKIRKQSFYDQINMKSFFVQKVQKLCQQTGGNLQQLASMLDQNDQGQGGYGKSLYSICR